MATDLTPWWNYCHSCNAHFPEVPGDSALNWFRVCGECLHCWKTEADLIEHDYRVQLEMYDPNYGDPDEWGGGPPPDYRGADQIHVCPCCGHDL